MSTDIWFTRHGDHLFVTYSEHDEPPTARLARVDSVRIALDRFRSAFPDKEIVQIGILPPDMLNLV